MQNLIIANNPAAQDQKSAIINEGQTIARGSKSLLALATLGVLCLNVPLRAGEQVPFKGQADFVPGSSIQVDATHFLIELEFDGRSSKLGNIRGPGSVLLDITTFTYVGEATWTAANGDKVFFTSTGRLIPSDTAGILDDVQNFQIVGGTGRFEGATGEGIAIGQSDATTLLHIAPVLFEGTISSPGSLKK